MPCPICEKDSDQTYRPFCSKRCADLDLGRWMTGSYRVETEEPPEDQVAPEDPQEWKH
ncbi:DNA gyrase inhibitor YacG [Aliishimia ponticola]|uniref:DNA gyrase inhibitor YacG n=1 Tax=Aliishimia ponticola TaxID=2499833 RepID=A0A4S4NCE1_9RHOB|nr:DNA gyrase inhibitor YacG [Aliishimia ponticola]THH36147.1 DNA gyrase inhibitor YacG [Aliishimia ponticola]